MHSLSHREPGSEILEDGPREDPFWFEARLEEMAARVEAGIPLHKYPLPGDETSLE